jgi:hypothetical protein
MQQQPDLKRPLPPEVRAYLQTIGSRGAAVHSLDQQARQLGVAVRKTKRALMAKGYSPEAALQKARAHLHLGGRP